MLDKIKKVINREEFIILTGARQTGKTSILLLLKEYLIKSGQQCFYFNLENQDNLNLLNKSPYNIFELIPESDKKIYVFLDEIHRWNKAQQDTLLPYVEKGTIILI